MKTDETLYNQIFRLPNLLKPDDPAALFSAPNFHMACINCTTPSRRGKSSFGKKGLRSYVTDEGLKSARYPARGSVQGRADSRDDIS